MDIKELNIGELVFIDDLKTTDKIIELGGTDFSFLVKARRVVECGEEVNILLTVKHLKHDLTRLLLIKSWRDLTDIFLYESSFVESAKSEIADRWMFNGNSYVEEIQDEFGNKYRRVFRDEVGKRDKDGAQIALIEYKAAPEVYNDRALFVETGVLNKDAWIEFWEGSLIEGFNVKN